MIFPCKMHTENAKFMNHLELPFSQGHSIDQTILIPKTTSPNINTNNQNLQPNDTSFSLNNLDLLHENGS